MDSMEEGINREGAPGEVVVVDPDKLLADAVLIVLRILDSPPPSGQPAEQTEQEL